MIDCGIGISDQMDGQILWNQKNVYKNERP